MKRPFSFCLANLSTRALPLRAPSLAGARVSRPSLLRRFGLIIRPAMPKSLFNESDRNEIARRIAHLKPDDSRRWGTMTAPQMILLILWTRCPIALEIDPALRSQVCLNSNDSFSPRSTSFLGPRARSGALRAFVTHPGVWARDVETLLNLLARFGSRSQEDVWPDHGLFGRMTGRDWGVLCYKHFDHHCGSLGPKNSALAPSLNESYLGCCGRALICSLRVWTAGLRPWCDWLGHPWVILIAPP